MSLTKYFEYEFYISKYKDTSDFSKNKALNHFLNIGMKEKRVFNTKLNNFDYEYFINNNFNNKKDIQILNNNFIKICNYFIENVNDLQFKYNSKLIFFDYNYYINKYSDLKQFNYFEATEHFLNCGINENRIFNSLIENYIDNKDNKDPDYTYKNFIKFIINSFTKQNKCIILDSYIDYGLKTHTDILHHNFNYDVFVFDYKNENNKYNIKYFRDTDIEKYSLLIFQHTLNQLPYKQYYQKFIYIVHCKISTMNYTSYNSFLNKIKYIDYYVFVSEEVKVDYINVINNELIKLNKFENYKNIFNNSCVIENTIPFIENDKKIIKNLYICGSSYTPHKKIIELITDFSKFSNNNFNGAKKILKIYGDKSNSVYFKQINEELKNLENMNNMWEIHLNDSLEKDEYLKILKECEYYCMYSKGEGNSYALLEAMTLNKKIICSEKCITTEIGKKYTNKRHNFEEFELDNTDFKLEHNSIDKFEQLFEKINNL